MSDESFVVLGKFHSHGAIQYVCRIDGDKWFVPDDLANTDRQRVQEWIDAGNPVADLTTEEAASL